MIKNKEEEKVDIDNQFAKNIGIQNLKLASVDQRANTGAALPNILFQGP